MDLSKLGQNERLALLGAIAVVVAGLISGWGGLVLLAILAAVGVAVVVFLPQFSASTRLPGSKGSLMAALGFVAAGSTLITLLSWIGFLGALGFNSLMLLVALVGSLVMAWAGWQELQAEGGRWRFGSSDAGAGSADAPPAAAPTSPAAAAEPEASEPGHDTEGRASTDEPRADERGTEI